MIYRREDEWKELKLARLFKEERNHLKMRGTNSQLTLTM